MAEWLPPGGWVGGRERRWANQLIVKQESHLFHFDGQTTRLLIIIVSITCFPHGNGCQAGIIELVSRNLAGGQLDRQIDAVLHVYSPSTPVHSYQISWLNSDRKTFKVKVSWDHAHPKRHFPADAATHPTAGYLIVFILTVELRVIAIPTINDDSMMS